MANVTKNSGDRILMVGLCLDDVDTCSIVLGQLAAGQVFGMEQKLHLMLQGPNLDLLEEVCMDLQDCAYPLVTGISAHLTLGDVQQKLDAVIVVLASRCPPLTSTSDDFQTLARLVTYIHDLSRILCSCHLDNVKILVTGSNAMTAVSLLSYKLKGFVSGDQLLAIDGEQVQQGTTPKLRTRCYGQIHRVCRTIREWWTGVKSLPSKPIYLGTKFLALNKLSESCDGYFFSTPVEMEGPKQFSISGDANLDEGHIAEVKAKCDKALVMMTHLEGKTSLHTEQVFKANL